MMKERNGNKDGYIRLTNKIFEAEAEQKRMVAGNERQQLSELKEQTVKGLQNLVKEATELHIKLTEKSTESILTPEELANIMQPLDVQISEAVANFEQAEARKERQEALIDKELAERQI